MLAEETIRTFQSASGKLMANQGLGMAHICSENFSYNK